MDSKWIVGGSLAMAATGFSLYGLYSWVSNPSIPAEERNPTNSEEIAKDTGGPDETHDVDNTIVKSIFNCSSSEPSGGGVNLLENAEGTTSAYEGQWASADKEKTEKTDSQTCAGTSIASSSAITHGREDHVLSLKVSASNTNNQADEGSVVTYSSAETQTFPMDNNTVSETPDLLSSVGETVGILNRPRFQRFDSTTVFDQISMDACPSLEESSPNESNSPHIPVVSGSHATIPSKSTAHLSNDVNIPVTMRTEEVTYIEQRFFLGRRTRIPLEREALNSKEKGCDIVILYAEDDYRKAVEYKRHLESTLGKDANVLLFEEYDLNVQSEFRTIEGLFSKCRFVFVYVTKNLKEDELKLYQEEMCLMDSIKNKDKKWRVVPIWPEKDSDKTPSAPLELTVLRGLKYWQFNLGATENDCPYVSSLKKLFKRGREHIMLRK